MKTTIDHKIRSKLKLTYNEYVLIDYIYNKYNDKVFKSGSERDKICKKIMFNPEEYRKAGLGLKNKSLLITTGTPKEYRVSDKWANCFADLKQEFEAFWLKYKELPNGTAGNKNRAYDMFKKIIKEVELEHLYYRMEEYEKFLNASGQQLMYASTWLNPQYRRFDDDFNTSKFKNKNDKSKTTETTHTGGFYRRKDSTTGH